LGADFSKSYIKRNTQNYYIKPFLLITGSFLFFFSFDLFTAALDHYFTGVEVEKLIMEQSIFYEKGDLLKGQEILNKVIVLLEQVPTGIVTKFNIVIGWYLFKNFL